MRFRRRTKILPGVYLNFSKTGISTTVGPRGANVNLGKQGAFLNTGIPGTGLYDRKKIGSSPKQNKTAPKLSPKAQQLPEGIHPHLDEIKSQSAEATTSDSLFELKETLLACHERKNELKLAITRQSKKVKKSKQLLTWMRILIVGFIFLSFRRKWLEAKHELKELQLELDAERIDLDLEWPKTLQTAYEKLEMGFEHLMSCHKVWDIIGAGNSASLKGLVVREECTLNRKALAEVKSKQEALHFQNLNAGDLYFYPFFIAILDGEGKFGLVDIRDLNLTYEEHEFTENNEIPLDSEVIDHRWFKENKDNSRDKRFKNNFQIPVCAYAGITMKSKGGVHEKYMFSSRSKAKSFYEAFKNYQTQVDLASEKESS